MKLRFYHRDFSALPIQPDLDIQIGRYSCDVMGGPIAATAQASGDRDRLFELINLMRAPVEILTDRGELVWWGFLEALNISTDSIQFGVDINTMSNRVAVAYTTQNQRFTTVWSGDANSIGEYGIKELLLSHSDCTLADALSERDTRLAAAKNPIPTLKFGSTSSGTAELILKGWYSTFEWQYYVNYAGFEGYEVTGQGGREVGEDDRPILAMAFSISAASAWNATAVWLRVWYQGGNVPGDSLTISLKADGAGIPGTTLASASVVGNTLSENAEWVEFRFNTPVTLNPATTYWIHAARTGAIDESAFYMLDTNLNSGYQRGSMLYFNTNVNAWVSAAHKGDLLFKLIGEVSTDAQIQTLVTNAGQFYTGTILEVSSGIETIPYRNGDSTGLYELEKLLAIGTSNSRRMLAETTHNRYLRVYEEPAKPSAPNEAYGLGSDGQLFFPGTRNLVDGELCSVGIWCRLVDVIPPTVDLSLIADPNMFFIEAAEVDAQKGEYQILRTRDQANYYDIGGVEQG